MFSGIIEELGRVKKISKRGQNVLLEIRIEKIQQDAAIGESISVNGACLTIANKELGILGFEVMSETLRNTNLGSLRINEEVNLERALRMGSRISGHFVTGHVDCLGIIRAKKIQQSNLCFEIAVPSKFMRYIIPKGSVAVDGISLTIMEKKSSAFGVYVIPHTLKNTTLGFKGPSDKVNIEFDILAKKAQSC